MVVFIKQLIVKLIDTYTILTVKTFFLPTSASVPNLISASRKSMVTSGLPLGWLDFCGRDSVVEINTYLHITLKQLVSQPMSSCRCPDTCCFNQFYQSISLYCPQKGYALYNSIASNIYGMVASNIYGMVTTKCK